MKCPSCRALLKRKNNLWVCDKCNCSKTSKQIEDEINEELKFWRAQKAEITIQINDALAFVQPQTMSTAFFGRYPQSLVEDKGIISILNDISNLSTLDGWHSMRFNISGQETDCVMYRDISYESCSYRGIFIKEYRPYWGTLPSDESTTFQHINGYKKNNVYWFRYEPIKWQILATSEDSMFLYSEKILDSTCFKSNDSELRENGLVIYSNNWERSDLRIWLNHVFFNVAFVDEEKQKIIPQLSDNSTTGAWNDQYALCQVNTQDNICIPSYSDATNVEFGLDSSYMAQSANRRKQGTDYAKCMGLWVDESGDEKNSVWWLRSSGNHGCRTIGVGPKGNLSICGGNVYDTDYGIVPKICILKDQVNYPMCSINQTKHIQKRKIVYGKYPQHRVYDEDLCEVLKHIAGDPVTSELWKAYNDCPRNMKYADLDYNGNQYRGVYIIDYRPYYSKADYDGNEQSFQLSNGYEKGKLYWFLYSDIEWDSFISADGIIIQSTILLDCVHFSCVSSNDSADWTTSYLNTWLNTDFLEIAFVGDKHDNIDDVMIPTISDVTCASMGCKNNGNMFDESRIKTSTDYAKCRGIYLNDGFKAKHQKKSSFWWLRDKGTRQNKVAFVNENGIVCYNGLLPNSASCGVLPQIQIDKDGVLWNKLMG